MKKILVSLALIALASPVLAETSAKRPAAAPVQQGQISQGTAKNDPIAVLRTFTINDLQAALDDANAHGDTIAAQCYEALIPLAQTSIGNPLPKGLGAFQALQAARDAKALVANIQSPTGPLAKLNVSCAPLVLDVQNTLIQLGIVGGTVAAGAGLTLPIALPFPLLFK